MGLLAMFEIHGLFIIMHPSNKYYLNTYYTSRTVLLAGFKDKDEKISTTEELRIQRARTIRYRCTTI